MQKSSTEKGTIRIANKIFFKEVIELLSSGNDVLFTINGNSMRPFLSHGDKVLISPINEKNITFGKIILANSNYGYVLHRLVWRSEKYIWLTGDNNLIQVEKIDKTHIIGYVKYAENDGYKIDVNSFVQLFFAFTWFFLRPFRLLIFKLKRIFRLK